MSRFLFITLLSFVQPVMAGNVTAYFNYAVFNTPGKGPYVETYLSVLGNTVKYQPVPGGFQAGVEISMLFKQGEEIKSAKKYTVLSPLLADTLNEKLNFIDQQRFPLPNGKYILEIGIADQHVPGKSFQFSQSVEVDIQSLNISLSDIQMLESYTKSVSQNMLTKSGYDLVPLVNNVYPEKVSRMPFYCEIYNARSFTGDSQKIVLTYSIESFETQIRMNKYNRFSTQLANNVNILLAEFSIKDLPSGNYNLVVEVKDKQNQVLASRKMYFRRKNPSAALDLSDISTQDISKTFAAKINSMDSLSDFIRSLRPLSTESEKTYSENQLKGKDLKLMQQYFYNFWASRYPADPEGEWLKYGREVKKVNAEFGTQTLKGYDTDRGRVYLQYGPPSARTVSENEPSSYPYEIWHYYKLRDQSNRKFVFYSRDMVTNNYELIHSDARGEIYDNRWELKLQQRISQSRDLDDESAPDHYGGRTLDNFRNPRD